MSPWSLQGKTVLLTGATSGIGLAAAEALAVRGARLVLTARNPVRAEAAVARIRESRPGTDSDVLAADFASLAEVAAAARRFLASGRPLDVLLNNAGLMNTSRKTSRDGFEEMLAVNHLAPYLLTRLLLPRLQEAGRARIVHVASNAHAFCKGIDFDDLQLERRFRAFPAYGHSKLANILFNAELARRIAGSGVTTNALHPGAVATGIGTNNGGLSARIVPLLMKPFFRSPAKGAETAVWLADSAAVEGLSGGYYHDCRPIEPKPWGRDAAAAARLWDVSEQLVGEHL